MSRSTSCPRHSASEVASPASGGNERWLQFMPTPTSSQPRVAVHSTPASLRPPTSRSFGHLIDGDSPSSAATSASAQPTRSGTVAGSAAVSA